MLVDVKLACLLAQLLSRAKMIINVRLLLRFLSPFKKNLIIFIPVERLIDDDIDE